MQSIWRKDTVPRMIERMMRWFLLLLAVLLVPAAAEAQPVLVSADMRQAVDLDGPWNWSVDPYRDGLSGFHGGEAAPGHRRYDDIDTTAAMRADPKALYEYDMDRSPVVQLPQSFVTHSPDMRRYNGLVWYQRHFTAHSKRGERAFLRFGAVDYHAYVYVNGKFVGEHLGGFTPFAFEVTSLLRDGDNRITVGADSERTTADVPPVVTDWENYGGITRPVSLVTTPATYIDDAWVRLTKDGRLMTSIQLDGPDVAERHVRIRIPELGYDLDGRTDDRGYWAGLSDVPKGMQCWSPENPKLYDVVFESGADVLHDRIGFRTIAVRGQDILLNGRPIFLRGVNIHAEEFGARSDPRHHARSGARAAHRSQTGPPRQFRAARPLSASRDDASRGGRTRPARVERNPGLLAGRFCELQDAGDRAPDAAQIHPSRPQPRFNHPLERRQ